MISDIRWACPIWSKSVVGVIFSRLDGLGFAVKEFFSAPCQSGDHEYCTEWFRCTHTEFNTGQASFKRSLSIEAKEEQHYYRRDDCDKHVDVWYLGLDEKRSGKVKWCCLLMSEFGLYWDSCRLMNNLLFLGIQVISVMWEEKNFGGSCWPF